MPGQESVAFSFYGAPADAAALRELVEVMRREGLGNAFDPGPSPFPDVRPAYEFLAALGWPLVTLPPGYGEFQIADGRSKMGDEHEGMLRILDDAGVFNALQLGEWGYYFHELSHNEGWWRSTYGTDFEAQRHLMKQPELRGFDGRPATRAEAYEQVKRYYLNRNLAQRGRNMSVTGHSHYECYAAEWGTRVVGVELGENIAFTQSKLAFTRGAARQWQLPFSVQVSPWFGMSCTTAGPLTKGADNIARGMDAGHSLSFYRRMWLHTWFAGAALVTPENSAAIWFEPGEPKHRLTEHAKAAAQVFAFMQAHDRGTPYTPLGIVIDHHAGYNGYQGKPWGIFENTPGDWMLSDLLERQLFPGADHIRGPVPPGEHESRYLRPTPHGEIVDVVLTTARREVLSTYPVLLLAGDITFDAQFLCELMEALRAGSALLMQPMHAEALGEHLATFQGTGTVEVLEPWLSPETGRPAAISTARLNALAEEYLPVSVGGGAVQYQVNRNAVGWVVELVNNAGIDKRPDRAAVVDSGAAVEVRIEPRFESAVVEEWWTNSSLDPTAPVTLTIPPGESRFVAFTVSGD